MSAASSATWTTRRYVAGAPASSTDTALPSRTMTFEFADSPNNTGIPRMTCRPYRSANRGGHFRRSGSSRLDELNTPSSETGVKYGDAAGSAGDTGLPANVDGSQLQRVLDDRD